MCWEGDEFWQVSANCRRVAWVLLDLRCGTVWYGMPEGGGGVMRVSFRDAIMSYLYGVGGEWIGVEGRGSQSIVSAGAECRPPERAR